ncbi:general L-amino acid transport system substrate-binding protein [Tepidamorphus gemmatus]|uniref:General L-amino acid transport system substrate-binding protein n=1 Tax=Tepidamorphus gemmatus TaxID=747076 RepID=A0A4R3MEG2_9HYPH|nr:amino acid ABC transporter substrate-binding protein [Tepidamorphus gemmatus]TCT11403.1 general L-amino acid transport system substrate-binding protein [Tepidamorphus gemmatus]
MRNTLMPALLGVAVAFAAGTAAAATLDEVKSKGFLTCGSNTGLAGFGYPDDQGNWKGIDVDLCRAIAAAIFNDPEKVKFVPLSAKDRFTALQSGEVDVLVRNTTWTMSRDTALGLNFAGVNYYDGQGFMVRKDLGVTSAKELSGASVCVQQGTTTELNLADFFRANGMDYEVVAFASSDETVKAYDSGRCDAFTTDASGLYAERLKLTNPDEHIVLPEIISKEPLGPVVRQGDDQWFSLVKWVHNAMINAEELGVTQANVDEMRNSSNPEIKRLLGIEGEFGTAIGLTNDWAYNIIKHVGNYGETFDRNVGPDTELGIARGLNALWTKGGLMYAPPIR